MRRILLALAFSLFGTAAFAQGCGPQNPNCIVPTAPAGTSNNQAASTEFVNTAIGGATITPSPLTKADDTNVTVTLGGSPATALLKATSITMGWAGTLSVARGGTGIGSGTSGGIPYFNSTSTMLSSGLLGANQLMLGGGAGGAPATLGTLGTTTTVLHGNAAGGPSFGAVANADMATMAANTVKCNPTAGTAAPQDCPNGPAVAIYDVVATYGADPSGVVDATTAINNAVSGCQSGGGGVILIRTGQFKIASTVAHSGTAFCKFVGYGPDNATGGTSGTRLVSSSATAVILNITSSGGAYVENIAFDASVTRTGGAYLSVANSDNNNLIRNVSFSHYWTGLDLGWNNGTVDHALFWTPVPTNGTGITIHGNAGCDVLHDIEMFPPGPANQPNAGILIGNSGCVQISDSDIIQQGTNLLIGPGNGETASSIYVSNTFFDSAINGINIAPSGTGNVTRLQFVNTWTSSNTGFGAGISRASGTVSGITFTNHHSINNTTNGLSVASGPISALSVSRSLFANNGANGIFINAVVNGLDISGNFSGAYGGVAGNVSSGINVIAGMTDCSIVGNHLTGNGTALTDNTGCNNLLNLPAPAWTTFTPSPSCGTATFTVNSARRQVVGKIMYLEADISFTALGTCTNTLLWNLPVTAQSASALAGQDTGTGKAVGCGIRASGLTQANCVPADGTNYTGTSRVIVGGVYESQ